MLLSNLQEQFLKSPHFVICWSTVRIVAQCGTVQRFWDVVSWLLSLLLVACRSRWRHLCAWSKRTRWWIICRRWSIGGTDVWFRINESVSGVSAIGVCWENERFVKLVFGVVAEDTLLEE